VARRTETPPPPKRQPNRTALSLLIVLLTALFFILCVSLVPCLPPAAAARETAEPMAEFMYLIYPAAAVFFASYCLQALRRIGCKKGAAIFLTAGLCLALTVISFARSDVFRDVEWYAFFK
jgi:hypothetical protein